MFFYHLFLVLDKKSFYNNCVRDGSSSSGDSHIVRLMCCGLDTTLVGTLLVYTPNKTSRHKKQLFLFSFCPAMPSWICAERLKFQDLTSLVPFDSYKLFQFPPVLPNSQQLYSYSQQLYSNSQHLYSNSQ